MAKTEETAHKRVRAGRLMPPGKTLAEAAKSVGIAWQTSHIRKARLDEAGIEVLRSMATGRLARLDEDQRNALLGALRQGAVVHDFGTELRTLKLVHALIEGLYGMRFSAVHVWRLLGAMGFRSKKPERWIIERDDAALPAWKSKTRPALKRSVPPSGD